LLIFPLSLIGIDLFLTVSTKPQSPQAPTPIEEPTGDRETPTIVEPPTPVKLPASTTMPIANQVFDYNTNDTTCWFRMEAGGRLIGYRCEVSQRINDNENRVFDLFEPSGLRRLVVLWDNKEVEIFSKVTAT
jgi:hypothetical protein